MNIEAVVLIASAVIIGLVVSAVVYRRIPKKLKPEKFDAKWKELQLFCKDKATWASAVTSADRLLDEALKKRKFAGKSMGERLVSANKLFTDNDSVWHAHNLYKKITSDPSLKLKENDVKNALIGFRQALRDIGALPGNKEQQVSDK